MNQTHIKIKKILKKKYEINFLIYTLSFLVIYPSNCHFYKCQSNTQLFQKVLFNSFYQTLSFLKMHFFIMHFLKTLLFHYALLQKAEPNSPLVLQSFPERVSLRLSLRHLLKQIVFVKIKGERKKRNDVVPFWVFEKKN